MAVGATRIREQVWRANLDLAASGLVFGTFGNVSGVDREAGVIFIKPSGIPYDELEPDHMVPVSLATGQVQDSTLRPSMDTPIHLELYRAFNCGGVTHTRSAFATALAQARLPLPCMGTTHADYFRGDVPITRELEQQEVDEGYEINTGRVIVETFRNISPSEVTAVLVANHGPFIWGVDAPDSLERARVLELLARMECTVRELAPNAARPAPYLVDKHYYRKHGQSAYYGQPKESE